MPTNYENIVKLSKILYPTGRAFKMPKRGELEKLHLALAVSEKNAFEDALAVLDSILPDNDNFTSDDASDWERRLGMITNTATPLADRKLAIKRKMNHPGDIPARQNYLYLEGQLQAAGFTNLFVYENRFALYPSGYITKSPLEVGGGVGAKTFRHGQRRHGQLRHGTIYDPTKKVVNYIDEDQDALFDVGLNFRSTFFIGGNPIDSFPTVLSSRKDELRQLILKIKPVQTVAYLMFNWS